MKTWGIRLVRNALKLFEVIGGWSIAIGKHIYWGGVFIFFTLFGRNIDGKYVIISPLGRDPLPNTSARAYRVKSFSGRDAAVKLIQLAEGANEKEIQRSLKHEAELLQKLEHSNIIPFLGTGIAERWNAVYIITEYKNGGSFRNYLVNQKKRQHHPNVDEILDILQGVAIAIDHAHKHNVIHQDLKPENIVLERDENGRLIPFVVDFDIAVFLDSTVTTVGNPVRRGSPAYMCPEAWRPETPDRAFDMYSFGIMVYEAFEGNRPFDSITLDKLRLQHENDEPPEPKTISKLMGEACAALVLSLLDKNPSYRPQWASNFVKQLSGEYAKIKADIESIDPRQARRFWPPTRIVLQRVRNFVVGLGWTLFVIEAAFGPPFKISDLCKISSVRKAHAACVSDTTPQVTLEAIPVTATLTPTSSTTVIRTVSLTSTPTATMTMTGTQTATATLTVTSTNTLTLTSTRRGTTNITPPTDTPRPTATTQPPPPPSPVPTNTFQQATPPPQLPTNTLVPATNTPRPTTPPTVVAADRDEDGVPDNQDACPDQGVVAGAGGYGVLPSGCPNLMQCGIQREQERNAALTLMNSDPIQAECEAASQERNQDVCRQVAQAGDTMWFGDCRTRCDRLLPVCTLGEYESTIRGQFE